MACGKRTYLSENLALEALVEVNIQFPHTTVCNVYCCDHCGDWHLTSAGPMHDFLATKIKAGYIKRQQEAAAWQKKFY